MQRRALVFSSIAAAIAVGVVIWLLRSGNEGGEKSASTSGSGDKSPQDRDVASRDGDSHPRPELAAGSGPGGQDRPPPTLDKPANDFELEPLDAEFAKRSEVEISSALELVLAEMKHGEAVEVSGPECRTSRCRFQLTVKPPAQMPELLASLELPPFRQIAGQMKLGDLVNEPGKPAQVTVTLVMTESAGD